ncbi:MAG TPA: tRNA (N6-threonylcarbamoyladenosine(37)-N6)-methyltransferase TrmO [Spirochaetota bacterium]|nr:tRNA (N6-threonylcarbamoyladenosine(37)-N6)-methyltransferase TrmO [Spirochaetota bacterium]HPJ34276.1 tRNA (N6-threonylcarbamoyladenosine(37)-N6)-methyltransferase TrmO [Spirochaetota bacterium]
MITSLECVPCLIRQAIDASRFSSSEYEFQERVLRDILKLISEADLSLSPPVIAAEIHRRLRELSGVIDPFSEMKINFNNLILSMYDQLNEKVDNSENRLLAAAKLAIAGNVIDAGAKSGLTEEEVIESIESSYSEPLAGDQDYFIRKVKEAKKILYIADNAGEIVFDRLFIEKIGPEKVTLAVRGFPVINDATFDDARAAGIGEPVTIIDNGSDVPGTILPLCTEKVRKHFNEADLVIAKGQGNYETLCDENREIFFLLKVKCPIISDHTGLPVGTHAIIRSLPADIDKKPVPEIKKGSDLRSFTCRPIGIIHSEHTNPSETPIQPIYAKNCRGHADIFPEYSEGLKDLEGFSHIYIIFQLHKAGPLKLQVKPFLDITTRGVFSTRAPSRPNPIGMSIVELVSVDGNRLHLDGLDILDGTPIIDIKPYTARFDKIDNTRNGWQDTVEESDAQQRGKRDYNNKKSN